MLLELKGRREIQVNCPYIRSKRELLSFYRLPSAILIPTYIIHSQKGSRICIKPLSWHLNPKFNVFHISCSHCLLSPRVDPHFKVMFLQTQQSITFTFPRTIIYMFLSVPGNLIRTDLGHVVTMFKDSGIYLFVI